MSSPIRLNLGGGDDPACQLPGHINVDRKCGGEIFPLRIPRTEGITDSIDPRGGCIDEIRASHCLEHLSHKDARAAIKQWAWTLKPGGVLKIAVPNFAYCAEKYLAGEQLPIAGYVMGGQTHEDDFHRSLWDEEELRAQMESAGLRDIKPWTSEVPDCASLPVSLNLMGTKAAPIAPTRQCIPRTAAVMSMPRLAFSDNMFSVIQIVASRNLHFDKVTGAFWGQCLTRVIEPHLEDGTEWILLVDYDTVVGVEQFDELCRLMLAHPEADAIAPVQIKREESNLLMGLTDASGKPLPHGTRVTVGDFEPELVRVSWAHCGFTLIRVAALRKLAKPWFHSTPDAKGGWGEGRVDDDIFFWRRWAEAGNTAYLAPHVPVGHAQLVVTWPDLNLQPIHQYTTDYYNKGLPQGVRA
jgi:hypothetical protein